MILVLIMTLAIIIVILIILIISITIISIINRAKPRGLNDEVTVIFLREGSKSVLSLLFSSLNPKPYAELLFVFQELE